MKKNINIIFLLCLFIGLPAGAVTIVYDGNNTPPGWEYDASLSCVYTQQTANISLPNVVTITNLDFCSQDPQCNLSSDILSCSNAYEGGIRSIVYSTGTDDTNDSPDNEAPNPDPPVNDDEEGLPVNTMRIVYDGNNNPAGWLYDSASACIYTEQTATVNLPDSIAITELDFCSQDPQCNLSNEVLSCSNAYQGGIRSISYSINSDTSGEPSDDEPVNEVVTDEDINPINQALIDFLITQHPLALLFSHGGFDNLIDLYDYHDLIGRDNIVEEFLKCTVLQRFSTDMANIPIYSNQGGACAVVTNPDEADVTQQYFSDSLCQAELPFKPRRFLNFCLNALTPDRTYVGNAAAWVSDGDTRYNSIGRNTRWTLSHGATLDAWALSPDDNRRPFVKKAEYKNINGCQLEMGIYKQDINAENLKPLMFIHGGSFKFRGFGKLGLESAMSHLTERGYVVFAPYYRLMGNKDGPSACQNAQAQEIVADIEDALQWVQQNGSVLGSDGTNITLVGQSSGSHLAGWLATHPTLSSSVEDALLFYPPADTRFLAEQSLPGGLYENTFGVAKGLTEQLFDVADITDIDLSDPFLVRNAFPQQILDGQATAPMFIIHGNLDSLVPVEMATRMCDAKAGVALGTTPNVGGVYNCGPDTSELHVIDGAEHALDIRCFSEGVHLEVLRLLDPTITNVSDIQARNPAELPLPCPSGILGAGQVRNAITSGLDWLN